MYTPVLMYFPLDVYPKISQWKNCTHTELSNKKEVILPITKETKKTPTLHLVFYQ